ncbi:general stress protein CsbD [Micromonospora sp. C28SCA-DRY-2]|uniref:general stress protein CsbD n=1 Tax=Micromonospora sp. C28SCA-DRY-2 TaxID=3059522 RepID=UPI002676F725|nr:general stress protein CsbD [Micromonospora sp. C28SCA-DRY-2]MDO3701334.1 general stress protein CsbD [Micromonospora sp. C28SCA-DRY-2]
MSFERANDRVEQVAGPAKAQLGNMNQDERAQAERVMQRDRIRGEQPGEHVQEDARDVREDFSG